MDLEKGAHIHLMGICGTAMASLAGILKEMGYKITGSDQNVYPPMSTQLQDLGIEIMQGYKKENLNPKPDLVIVGNVISRTHEEAQALLESDIPYTSLPKAMGEFVIEDRNSVVICGTHGKTTTTSMAAVVGDACELKAGYMIGGIPENFSRSFRPAVGDWFFIEGDEYDTAFFDKVPKFIHYKPKYVILTSIEFDHADIYNSLDEIKEAFIKLMKLIPEDGVLIANADDTHVMDVVRHTRCKNVLTYGIENGDYKVVDRETVVGRNQFSVLHKDKKIADIAIKSFGVHNTMNALSIFALGHRLNWPKFKVLQGLAEFKGVKRRQQILGEPGGVTVIEDFAHHPTAVELTVGGIRERYPSQRILAVFEPRSATSRRRTFQKDYVKALQGADEVFVAAAYDQSKIAEDQRFSSQELVDDLKAQGVSSHFGQNVGDLVQQISTTAQKGDVVLIMSNGGFDGIYGQLMSSLEGK